MAALSQLVLLARSSPRRLTVSNSHCFFPTSLLQAPSRRCAASLVNRGEGMQFSRHLVDRRRIYVTGGHGGSGGLVYTRHTKQKMLGPGWPCGGSGGKGGDVILKASGGHHSLAHVAGAVIAESGEQGKR
ncbi:unnamed protein product, partial [Polarella glacialis]